MGAQITNSVHRVGLEPPQWNKHLSHNTVIYYWYDRNRGWKVFLLWKHGPCLCDRGFFSALPIPVFTLFSLEWYIRWLCAHGTWVDGTPQVTIDAKWSPPKSVVVSGGWENRAFSKAGQRAQWLNYFSCRHEDLSSLPVRKPGSGACSCNLSTQEAETEESLGQVLARKVPGH